MDTNSRNWRWARMAQLLAASALLLLQNSVAISADTSSVHIVYMGDKIYQNPTLTKKYHNKMLSSLLGSKEAAKSSILYSYKHGFSGFAARLTKHQAEAIAKFPGVVSVIPNGIHKLHTTRSWDFIGIHHSTSKSALSNSNLGEGAIIGGQSIDTGKHNLESVGLTYSERIALDSSENLAKDCQSGSLNATMAAGKIVLCFSVSDQQDIVSASLAVKEAGGVGLVYAQYHEDGLNQCGLFPCIKVDFETGTQILTYIRRSRFPTASLSFPTTVIGKWASPRVASFSSRGPSSMSPTVLKPDIGAPGVDILAAFPSKGTTKNSGFAFLSGTSMSCPHVAGIAALMKSKNPTWSPAAIRSALVTTAYQTGTDGNVISEEGSTHKAADPFDIGGGHMDPNKAMDPGLIYDITTEDYVQFLCSMGHSSASISKVSNTTTSCKKEKHQALNLNLPSISVPNLKNTATVMRRVTNVGNITAVYKALVKVPFGMKVRVEPQTLSFNSDARVLSFNVSFLCTQKFHGDYRFGSLTWTDGKHFVRSPIVVRSMQFES
ncbi:hypothetical protein ACSQ67_021988 [Phaseolus vulgaris]